MSLAVVRSRAPASGRAPEVTVEVHLANGLPSFSIVGLPDLEVRESRERVRAALQNCSFDFPVRRITVNLAPADLPKESGRFDLPIALGILAASGQIPAESLLHREFAGELSLTGALRPMRGAFAMACGTARSGASHGGSGGMSDSASIRITSAEPATPETSAQSTPQLYLPAASAAEAALVPGVDVYGATDLPSLCAHLAGAPDARLYPVAAPDLSETTPAAVPDMADVIGQRGARRALEVAAAGGHHVLLVGPPGAGKSMLAARLPSLLPPMTDDEALSSAALLSASRAGFTPSQWRQRPFRAPHHSSSGPALVGGRNPPQPGEITLAHLGVLFLTRIAGIRPPCAGDPARAPRGRAHHDLARRLASGFSSSLPVDRRDEPLPLRMARRPQRSLPMHAGNRGALSAQAVRAAARPDRHPARDSCAHAGGVVGAFHHRR